VLFFGRRDGGRERARAFSALFAVRKCSAPRGEIVESSSRCLGSMASFGFRMYFWDMRRSDREQRSINERWAYESVLSSIFYGKSLRDACTLERGIRISHVSEYHTTELRAVCPLLYLVKDAATRSLCCLQRPASPRRGSFSTFPRSKTIAQTVAFCRESELKQPEQSRGPALARICLPESRLRLLNPLIQTLDV
jgi:hypothetical protein